MCYASSCNPLCGNCRPKRIVQATCPGCGAQSEMSREEFLILFELPHRQNVIEKKIIERGGVKPPTCNVCGQDLLQVFEDAVTPRECKSNRVLCGYPCGRSEDPYRPDALPCPTMVPIGKLSASAGEQ